MCSSSGRDCGNCGSGDTEGLCAPVFRMNNKNLEYFLDFVDFFLDPTQEFCPNSPGQPTTGLHLQQPHLAFPTPVKTAVEVCHGHLHLSLMNLPRGTLSYVQPCALDGSALA